MKKVYFLAFVVLMLSCSAKDQKSNNIPLDWGKSVSELTGNFVPNGEKIGGCSGYVKIDESFNFEGITAHTVTYGFCDDKLTVLKVGLFNKDLSAIVEYLTGKYSKPDVSMNNGLVAYKWTKGMMVAVLLYDKNNGKGIELTMKNIDPNLEAAALVEDKVNLESASNSKSTAIPETMQVEKPCSVETLYDGFKCEIWGTPFDQMEGQFTKYEGKSSAKMDDYEKKGDDLIYEGIKTSTTIYSFRNGLFQGATMAMYNKDINKIVKMWTSSYGDPRVVDGAGFFTNYEWHLDGLLLTITYIHEKEDGIGVLAGVVCENNNFKVRKPIISAPASTSNSQKTVTKTSSTSSRTSESSGGDSRSSARDRLREQPDKKETSKVVKETKVEEPAVIEEPEEAPAEDSGTKSKRELLREKKEKK